MALAAGLGAPVGAETNAVPQVIRVATPAPPFEMESVAGDTIKLADLTAPAVIVSFWLREDKPSQRQWPVLSALQTAHGTNQVQVVGVLVESLARPQLREFVAREQLHFFVARYNSETIEGFGGLAAVPTTFVIDRNRNVIQRYVGWVDQAALEADVKIILAAAAARRAE